MSPLIASIRATLAGQLGAALKMVDGCAQACPDGQWAGAVGQFPFWHVAYHALYYADLYLGRNEEEFRPREFHRENYQFLGKQSWAPDLKIVADTPYDRATIRQYARHCGKKAAEVIAGETEASLAGASGFSWLPISRLEGHVYNIRHVQHHAGQLTAFLRRMNSKPSVWVRTLAPQEI